MVVHTRARNTFNLIAFIESLDRAEDEGAFSKDVIELYPHLKDAYCQLCPVRMDIAKMKKKAELGQYTAVADIKADILRISMNCVLFNGLESFMGTIAKNFERFALEKLHVIPDNFFSAPQREEEGKPAAAAEQPTPSPVSAAAATPTHVQHKIRLSGTAAPSTSSGGTKRTRGEEASSDDVVVGKVTPSASQLAEFVASLNREEDGDLFATDVLLTYPGIADSYNAVCPRRMDLSTMRKKALKGAYHRSSGSGGNSVSDELSDDLELIANNCITYNGAESVYGKSAARFQSFFRSALKEFRQDPVTYLSSRRFDGVEIVDRLAAAASVKVAPDHSTQASSPALHGGASKPSSAPPAAVKQVAPPPPPAPREFTTPAMRLLPFQVAFHIPDVIRKQLMTTHIVQEFKDCVLLQQGDARTVRCAVDSFICAIDAAEKEATANAEKLLDDAKKFAVKEEPSMVKDVVPAIVESEGAPVASKSCSDESTLSRATSAFVALRKLKIRRTEVVKLLKNMLRLFDDVAFMDVLLYRKERSDVDTYLTRHYNERNGAAVAWSEVAHVEYFIRFVVHFPQLAAVACARSAADSVSVAPGGRDHHHTSAKAPLNLKRMPQLDEASARIVTSAIEVVENFLCFAEAKYEWTS